MHIKFRFWRKAINIYKLIYSALHNHIIRDSILKEKLINIIVIFTLYLSKQNHKIINYDLHNLHNKVYIDIGNSTIQ